MLGTSYITLLILWLLHASVLELVFINTSADQVYLYGKFVKQIYIVYYYYNNSAMIPYIVTGVGGNLVAIQASRMSTYLHSWSAPGALPSKMSGNCPRPCVTFCSTGQKSCYSAFPAQ